MKYFSLTFTNLYNYAPKMAIEPRVQISMFILGVLESMVKEYRIAMLVRDMDTSRFISHDKHIGKENIKENESVII